MAPAHLPEEDRHGPMRQRRQRMLTTVERETVTAKGGVSACQAGRADALADQPLREWTDLPRTNDM